LLHPESWCLMQVQERWAGVGQPDQDSHRACLGQGLQVRAAHHGTGLHMPFCCKYALLAMVKTTRKCWLSHILPLLDFEEMLLHARAVVVTSAWMAALDQLPERKRQTLHHACSGRTKASSAP